MLKTVLVPVHSAGWPFIVLFASVGILMTWMFAPLGFIGLVLTTWCIYFFRDPPRVHQMAMAWLSALLMVLQKPLFAAPPELEMGPEPRTRVAVFMNVFNVHVNRIPITGTISATAYRPGKFFNASLDKASELNERNSLKVTTKDGQDVGFVQIAGLIARRIICNAKVGDWMRAGERFGVIRFGSRVDVYLPDGVAPKVLVGQLAVAGETVLADLASNEGPQQSETR